MESWMISLGVVLIGGIATSAVLLANVQRLDKASERHTNDLTSINHLMAELATMREVRQEFVSKEMFTQIRRHFDDEFKRLEQGVNKILTKLEK